MTISQKTAQAILDIDAVKIVPEPIKFKSGILSPVYTDNRIFISHPEEWDVIILNFVELIKEKKLDFHVVAGIETAGIPHSSALAYVLQMPSVFIRKEAKDHGTKKRVEGGDVKGKKVLLIEDLVSTGMSSLSGVQALRDEGAIVEDCLVIIQYEFPEAVEAFAKAKVNLHALTTFPDVLKEIKAGEKYSKEDIKKMDEWLADPWKWTKKHQ